MWHALVVHVSGRGCVKTNVNRFCLLAALLAVPAFAAGTPQDALLKKTEQRYNGASTLQVLFKQEYTRAGHRTRVESGTLQLRKPGRMRWEYTDPKGKLAVGDGKNFWTYDATQNQVEKSPLQSVDEGPLAFLLGKLHFDKEFRNLQSKPEGADTRISGEAKSENLGFTGIEFLVTPEGRIRQVKVNRFDNSMTTYWFDQETVNPKLDDKLFAFKPPAGVTVSEMGK